MRQYTVLWKIDILANSPKEAAQLALEVQRDTTSIATHFTIKEAECIEYDVDLLADRVAKL